jgi:hypothetical protein
MVPGTHKCATLATTVLAIDRMHAMQISHNDQHWINILVSTTEGDRGSLRKYQLEGKRYVIKTPHQPHLFDWDRSRIPGVDNAGLSLLPRDLYASKYDVYRDWLTFYRELVRHHKELAPYVPTLEALFPIFFRPDTPTQIQTLWNDAMKHEFFWQFSTDRMMQAFHPYISVDKEALLRYLGYVGVSVTAQQQTTTETDTVAATGYFHQGKNSLVQHYKNALWQYLGYVTPAEGAGVKSHAMQIQNVVEQNRSNTTALSDQQVIFRVIKEMTTGIAQHTYNIVLCKIDIYHLKLLVDVVDSWADMMAMDPVEIRQFLRKYSASFRKLQTQKGRLVQMTRLYDIIQAIGRRR